MTMLDLIKAPLVMGIINVTPDSFSGDGVMTDADYVESAVRQGVQMQADGAHILDIGGESTRPGAVAVSAEEEIRRVVPVIEGLRRALPTMPMAIDTMKAAVAEAAIGAGATIINDITALTYDPRLAAVAVKYGAYLILMHNRSSSLAVLMDKKIGGQYQAPAYDDVVAEVVEELQQRAALAEAAGVAKDKIILDPGIGFGKNVEQNLALIHHIDELKKPAMP